MLGNAVVILLFVAFVARPWVRAARSAMRRRNEAESWGPPLDAPPPGSEAEPVVLRGRLESDGAIPHLRGPATIAATLQGPAIGHLKAEGLRLLMSDASLPIEGRIEVLTGALEEHPRSMPKKTAHRFAEESKGGGAGTKGRPQLRRIAAGTEVVVRGQLERRVASGGQYREGAYAWTLIDGGHGEGITVVAAAPTRVRLPARDWLVRAVVTGGLLLGLVPYLIGDVALELSRVSGRTLRDCEPGGYAWLRGADWAARVQGAFPGFGERATERRARSLGRAINGVVVCRNGHEMGADWTAELVGPARRILPALIGHELFEPTRTELESTLHEAGLDPKSWR